MNNSNTTFKPTDLEKQLLKSAWDGDYADVEKLLLTDKVSINCKDRDGLTPLHWSAWNGHIDIVKLLLYHKADVNSESNFGYIPLHEACIHNRYEIVKLLIEHGGDIQHRNCYHKTPEDYARDKKYSKILSYIRNHYNNKVLVENITKQIQQQQQQQHQQKIMKHQLQHEILMRNLKAEMQELKGESHAVNEYIYSKNEPCDMQFVVSTRTMNIDDDEKVTSNSIMKLLTRVLVLISFIKETITNICAQSIPKLYISYYYCSISDADESSIFIGTSSASRTTNSNDFDGKIQQPKPMNQHHYIGSPETTSNHRQQRASFSYYCLYYDPRRLLPFHRLGKEQLRINHIYYYLILCYYWLHLLMRMILQVVIGLPLMYVLFLVTIRCISFGLLVTFCMVHKLSMMYLVSS